MARTPFCAHLRRLLQHSYAQALDNQHRAQPTAAAGTLDRRSLLGASLALGASVAGCTTSLAPAQPPAACQSASEEPASAPSHATPQVVVVGAGLAGVHCAYRLAQAGVNVMLYEASARTGGRTFSSQLGQFGDGQVCELGGELIDTDHRVMQHLAEEFDLALDYLPKTLPQNIPFGYQFYVGGKTITAAQIIEAFAPMAKAICAVNLRLQALPSEELNKAREVIDTESTLLEFLAAHGASKLLVDVLRLAYVPEFGLEMEELSVFNLLDLFPPPGKKQCARYQKGEGAALEFLAFGESDEVMRFHDGNQGPANVMTHKLGARVHLGHALLKITREGEHYSLDFALSSGGTLAVRAPRLVLALPFSKLREVEIGSDVITPNNLKIIKSVSYGTNSKLMGQFKSRSAWRDTRSDGTLVTDLQTTKGRAIQNLWDTSRGQSGEQGLWTNFTGGSAGLQVAQGTPAEQWASMFPALKAVFPKIEDEFTGPSTRMLWPTHRWTMGSYMAVRPGEVKLTDAIPHSDGQGALQFCGEHTSEAFQGFMEGAAETGARAASDILTQLGIAHPVMLSRLQKLHDESVNQRVAWRRQITSQARAKNT